MKHYWETLRPQPFSPALTVMLWMYFTVYIVYYCVLSALSCFRLPACCFTSLWTSLVLNQVLFFTNRMKQSSVVVKVPLYFLIQNFVKQCCRSQTPGLSVSMIRFLFICIKHKNIFYISTDHREYKNIPFMFTFCPESIENCWEISMLLCFSSCKNTTPRLLDLLIGQFCFSQYSNTVETSQQWPKVNTFCKHILSLRRFKGVAWQKWLLRWVVEYIFSWNTILLIIGQFKIIHHRSLYSLCRRHNKLLIFPQQLSHLKSANAIFLKE